MNRHGKSLKLTGAALIFISVLLAFGWFVWLAPVKHIYSVSWLKAHSHRALWEEAQKSVGRIGVTHDVGIEIGQWGDKAWATWIIKHIKPGQNIASCESSHLGEALADITNHQLEQKTETWLAWWQTNQNKTQVEWIREGFAERGLVLRDPLTTNNIIDLLALSHLATNSPIYTNIPIYLHRSLRMNAFRWLRDSGLSPWDIRSALSGAENNTLHQDESQLLIALIDYAEWYGQNWDGPGKLPLRKDFDTPLYGEFAMFTKIHWFVCFSVPMLALIGLVLLRRPSKQ